MKKSVSGVLAGGALHWVVSRKHRWLDRPSGDLIAAFDLRSEEYSLVPQLEYSIKNFDMKVDVLEGCLCVLFKDFSLQFEMWVMEDYGVEKSWTKLISCVDPNIYWFHDIVLPATYVFEEPQASASVTILLKVYLVCMILQQKET